MEFCVCADNKGQVRKEDYTDLIAETEMEVRKKRL